MKESTIPEENFSTRIGRELVGTLQLGRTAYSFLLQRALLHRIAFFIGFFMQLAPSYFSNRFNSSRSFAKFYKMSRDVLIAAHVTSNALAIEVLSMM